MSANVRLRDPRRLEADVSENNKEQQMPTGYRTTVRTPLPPVEWSWRLHHALDTGWPARDALPTTDPEEC